MSIGPQRLEPLLRKALLEHPLVAKVWLRTRKSELVEGVVVYALKSSSGALTDVIRTYHTVGLDAYVVAEDIASTCIANALHYDLARCVPTTPEAKAWISEYHLRNL